MSTNSLIAKSVILVSALIGGVVGMFELSDRLGVSTESEGGIVNQSGGLGGSRQTSENSDDDSVLAQEKVAATESAAVGSALQEEISVRVAERLARFDCADVAVDEVTATAIVVPDAETSHGFEGHRLEAAVVLRAEGGAERVRLAGSGKGPTGAVGAMDMALRGFDEQVTQTEIFKENCKGD